MKTAYLITKEDCPFCVKAKGFLEGLGVPYQTKVVGQDVGWSEVQEKLPGVKTVPQIWIGDEYVGGYDNLTEWVLTNEH